MSIEIICWRRLDTPGHDVCRLAQLATGWQVVGTAVFLHEGIPAQLAYQVTCDDAWITQHGQVHGWVGAQAVAFQVARHPDGRWTLNGAAVPNLAACYDLDLGFTPATNLLQLRRIALQVGQATNVPVAWLDLSTKRLDLLEQHYARRSETTYWYDAPRFAYTALLEVAPSGFVVHYPTLWQAEP